MNFRSLESPYFCILVGSGDELGAFAFRLNYELTRRPHSSAVRLVRGKKMKTRVDLFNEFAAAFQFPDYFGENWAALDECLSDLEWLPADGYVMLMSNVAGILSEEDSEDRAIFLRLLARVCKYWATEHRVFPSREPKPIPFHILFHATESEVNFVSELVKPHCSNTPVMFVRDIYRDQDAKPHD
jgi:hypothetical protein